MHTPDQITQYINGLNDSKQEGILLLHQLILQINPKIKLWFSDGLDEKGKIVSNPTIGYGSHQIKYTNGSSKEFFQIGLSANTTGISVYILGLKNKDYLKNNFANTIGSATISGYCIKFKSIQKINPSVIKKAIEIGLSGEQ